MSEAPQRQGEGEPRVAMLASEGRASPGSSTKARHWRDFAVVRVFNAVGVFAWAGLGLAIHRSGYPVLGALAFALAVGLTRAVASKSYAGVLLCVPFLAPMLGWFTPGAGFTPSLWSLWFLGGLGLIQLLRGLLECRSQRVVWSAMGILPLAGKTPAEERSTADYEEDWEGAAAFDSADGPVPDIHGYGPGNWPQLDEGGKRLRDQIGQKNREWGRLRQNQLASAFLCFLPLAVFNGTVHFLIVGFFSVVSVLALIAVTVAAIMCIATFGLAPAALLLVPFALASQVASTWGRFGTSPQSHFVILAQYGLAFGFLLVALISGGQLLFRFGLDPFAWLSLGCCSLGLWLPRLQRDRFLTQRAGVPSPATAPQRLVLFRVFGWESKAKKRLHLLLGVLRSCWAPRGPIGLIGGPDWLGSKAARSVLTRQGVERHVARNEGEVDSQLEAMESRPRPTHWFGAPTFGVHSLLCSEDTWRYGAKSLVEGSDLVLMDLREYDDHSKGCAFELELLVRNLEAWRFLLIIDDEEDLDPILKTLQAIWRERGETDQSHAVQIMMLCRLDEELVVQDEAELQQSPVQEQRSALEAWLLNAAARAQSEGGA